MSLKNDVLTMLQLKNGEYISGQAKAVLPYGKPLNHFKKTAML